MATAEKDLKGLSDAELDSQIEYGIQQQENTPRHSQDYLHFLNVVAAAKEEKARRGGEDAAKQREGSDNKKIADKVEDKYVEETPMTAQGAQPLHLAPDPTAKQKKEALEKKSPKPVDPEAEEIDASKINQGIPGIEPKAADKTPENKNTNK